MHRPRRLLGLLIAPVLVLTACASDGEDATDSSSPTSTADGSSEEETTDEESSEEETTDEESSDESSEEESSEEQTSEEGSSESSEPGSSSTNPSRATTTITAATAPTSGSGSATTTTVGSAGGGSPTTAAPAPVTTAPPTTSRPTTPPTTVPPTTVAPPQPDLQPGPALTTLNQTMSTADFTDGFGVLETCTLDPTGQLTSEIHAGLGGGFAEALAAETVPLVVQLEEPYPPMLSCDRFADSFESGVGLSSTPAPADLEAFSNSFANPAGIDGIDVTVTPAGGHRGGTFFHVCGVDTVDPPFTYCEVDWISGGLMMTAWVTGTTATGVDLDAIQSAMAPRLETLLQNLAAG